MWDRFLEIRFTDYTCYEFFLPSISQFLKSIFLTDHSVLVEASLNEAVNNALKHGSKKQNAIVTVRFEILNNKKLLIRVKDEGNGFPAHDVLLRFKNKHKEGFEDVLWQESGRGILMMLHFMDRVIYNNAGNEVLLVKNIQTESRKQYAMVC